MAFFTTQMLWLVAVVVLVIVEALTYQMVAIWFSLGAVAALLASLFGLEAFEWQFLIFVAVSILSLLLTRPVVKRVLTKQPTATNVERMIGQTGRVILASNGVEKGRVQVSDLDWNAICEEPLEVGDEVEVLEVQGTALHVKKRMSQNQDDHTI